MALRFVVTNNYLFVSCSAEDNKQQDGLTEDDYYDEHELADPYSESPDEIENYGKANSLTFAKLRLYSE